MLKVEKWGFNLYPSIVFDHVCSCIEWLFLASVQIKPSIRGNDMPLSFLSQSRQPAALAVNRLNCRA